MDYYDDDDGRDDFGVDSRASKLPTRQVDVAEEPEESQEVEAAERNFEGEDKNSEDERDEEEAEAKMLQQEEGVDLKDFENTSPDLKNAFVLHLCYKNVRMEYHNLLDQCGARDFILVDLDAILQQLLSQSNYIDFEDHGGQFLHLTYSLETFIQNMRDRTIRFEVISFEKAGRAPCDVVSEIQSRPDFTSFKRYNVTVNSRVMSNQYLFARLAIKNHLETKLDVKCHTFNHWIDDEWKQFLLQSRPAFVVSEYDALLFMYHTFLINNVPVVCNVHFKSLAAYGFSTELYTDIPSQIMQMIPGVIQSFDAIHAAARSTSAARVSDSTKKIAQLAQKDPLFALDNNKIATAIIACCNLLQGADEQDFFIKLHISQLLLATLLLQAHVPLAYRSQRLDYKYPAINSFLEELYGEILTLVQETQIIPDLYDAFDGRLLHTLLNIQTEKLHEVGKPTQLSTFFQLDMPQELQEAFALGQSFIQSNGASHISNDSQIPNRVLSQLMIKEEVALLEEERDEDGEEGSQLKRLLPIHNNLIDDYLSDVRLPELPDSSFDDLQHRMSRSSDTAISHWSAKQDLEVKLNPRTLQRRKEAQDASLKRLHDYAESLGKVNEKRAIETEKSEVVSSPVEEEGKKGGKAAPKKKEPKKPKTSKSAESIIFKNSIKKNSDELESILKQYRSQSETKIVTSNYAALMRSLEDYVKGITTLLHSSWKIKAMVLESSSAAPAKGKKPVKASPEVQMISDLIKRLENTLIEFFCFELKASVIIANQTKNDSDYYKVIEAVNFIYDYLGALKKERQDTFADVYKLLITSLTDCGFAGMAAKMAEKHPESKIAASDHTEDLHDPNILQLKYNYKFRSIHPFFPEEKPPVVHMEDLDAKQRAIKEKMIDLGFRPDPWQNELIEHVDRNKSILVAAPTSSGKTFIAFYVIEKILRENDDSVVVFCLPTKALTNQVFAEIYSKYTKKYAHPESRQMLGMFTSSDRINVTSAQILITIPQCLEIMMFSHTREHVEWRERLKYVILDEIHCMNSDSGDVWEHILLMVKCPFLALSATIGNPREFTQWLSLNKSNVELVEHRDRPQPLEFQIFQPALDEDESKLVSIHPLAVLNAFRIVDQEIDRLSTFSAAECLKFFDATNRVCSRLGVENIFAECSPAKLSENFGLIDRSQLLEYRKLVTRTVQKYAKQPQYHSLLLEIFASIRNELDTSFSLMNARYSKRVFESQHFLKKHFCELIMTLKQQQQLPTICFYFSRYFIDKLLEVLLIYVKTNRINLWETERDRSQALLQIAAVCEDLSEHVDEVFIEALKYGISVHYNAIHEDYQKAVERLYRQRALPVVIATSTLALGIHMPARSVVIVGKSKFLDTTLFYQCAGRAGRRGFDTIGRVCIYGIDQATVNRYMTSAPPSIMGSLGLKPSFLLRMLISYYETMKHNPLQEQLVRTDYLRVLQQPLFVLGKILPQTLNQVKHYFRYSTEFLMRNGYVDTNGSPLSFAGFISRMHYHEPYNFMLSFFTHDDKLHKLVEDEEIAYEKRLEALLAVLAYFFGRIKVFEKDVMCRTLPRLPDGIFQSHKEYTSLVKSIYSDYVTSYAITCQKENEDTELPLSHMKFKYVPSEVKQIVPTLDDITQNEEQEEENDDDLVWRSDEEEEEEVEETPTKEAISQSESESTGKEDETEQENATCGEIVRILKSQRYQNHATSSFAGLSGNHDKFSSIEQLLATVKHTIVIDSSVIPSADLDAEILNSYVVDFFSHGHLQRLCRENSFHSANAAKALLSEVNNDLRNLRNALDTMKIPDNDILLKAIRDLSTEFSRRFHGYETRRKRDMLKNVRVEASDMDVYGPRATREEKKYGDKYREDDVPQKRAKEGKERRSGKQLM